MEEEVIKAVLNEVLEEFKEVKQQQSQTLKILLEMKDNVAGFEEKLTRLNCIRSEINTKQITFAIDSGLNEIKEAINTQPKSTTRQLKIMFFPENNATEYYKIVFGRLLFWMMIFLTSTYLFVLGKQFIEGYIKSKQNDKKSIQYRNAWNYLYDSSKKSMKKRMDTVWMKSLK